MMRLILAFLLMVPYAHVQAELLFLNLNDAPQEIAACEEGLKAKAARTGKPVEPLHVVHPTKGETIGPDGVPHTKTYWALRQKLLAMPEGTKIDGIVISGDDGSGRFFGSQGEFFSWELDQIYREFPQLRRHLNSAALWGCYTTTASAASQNWIASNDYMKLTMGFTLRGPNKTRTENHTLLNAYCDTREEAVALSENDQLCDFYNYIQELPGARRTTVGICNRTGLATASYVEEGKPQECLTYDDLNKRCGDFFAKLPKAKETLQAYVEGRIEPPPFKETEVTPIRKIYNDLNLWHHCKDHRPPGNADPIPNAMDVIRLVKYSTLKANVARLNAKQLAEFDQNLERMGLSQFKLGDISNQTRAESVQRINAAMTALAQVDQGLQVAAPAPRATEVASKKSCGGALFCAVTPSAPKPAVEPVVAQVRSDSGVNAAVMRKQIACIHKTFVLTSEDCTRFSTIDSENASVPSRCVMGYNQAQEFLQNSDGDPCP